MRHLEDEEIIDLIASYLSESIYNYAIMINGEWGTGKTYFINEVLTHAINAKKLERDAIYVSLYGVQSTEDIQNSLFTSIVELKMGEGKKLLPFISGGTKIAAEIIGNFIGSDKAKKLDESIISPFVKYESYYFIFDDLERCSMPINDVLGFINHFLEQNNAKVIIVANENEIGSAKTSEINLAKFYISTIDSIDWPEKEKKGIQLSSSVKPAKTDLDELKRRSKLILDEKEYYQQVKEKLVGQTITYLPSLKKVVPNLLTSIQKNNNFFDTNQDVLVEKICEVMNAENHYNLRTIQFSLGFFCKIVNELELDSDLVDAKKEAILDILEDIIRVSVSYKLGRKEYNWGESNEYGRISLKDFIDYGSYFTSFKFVHEYVFHGSYNPETIKLVLDKYFEEISMRIGASKDPINILSNYWVLEDDIVVANVKIVYANIEQGKYKGQHYRWILSLIYKLKEIELEPIPIDDFIRIMKINVYKGEELNSYKVPVIQQDDEFFSEYCSALDELKAIEMSVHQVGKKDTLNSIFDIEHGWGLELYKYCVTNDQSFTIEKGFFKLIDIEKCFDSINNSDNQDLNYFRRILSNIYNFTNLGDYFTGDVENIEKLNTLLVEENYKHMKLFNIKLLKKDLDSIVLRIKQSAGANS